MSTLPSGAGGAIADLPVSPLDPNPPVVTGRCNYRRKSLLRATTRN
jgi:hypothetical protein